jgi:cell wall-associated NlpC family hydrolase
MPTELPTDAPKTAAAKSARPSQMGAKIERIALSQIGAPYSYGGMTPAGFDCSGFTSWVYSHVGITLPHSSSAQYSLGGSNGYTSISEISELEVGDLVFHGSSGGIQHAGIYVGNDEFISATSSAGVQVRSLFDSYWGPLWVGGVRPPR